MKIVYPVMAVLLFTGLVACKPPARPAAKPSGSAQSGSAGIKGLQAEKVEGGSFSFAEVNGLELFIVYVAPWTESGRNIQTLISDLERAGVWVLPVMFDNRSAANRTVDFPVPKARLPAVWSDDHLVDLAGGVRALPSVVQLNEQGKMVKKWQGHVASGLLLAERVKPQ